ncbi:MAG: hypothetical protein HY264_08210 [Chloroflexi bacterium]|nr:hypothetical protein [Chloroflexota bacterium]
MEPKKTRLARRFVGAAVGAVLLAGLVAGPVAAAKPGGGTSSHTTISLAATCQFTVTLTFSGFGGKVLPEVGLVYRTGTPLDEGIAYSSPAAAVSGRSGTWSHTFVLTDGGTSQGQYTAVGRLYNSQGREITGSKSTPGFYISGGTCGRPVIS